MSTTTDAAAPQEQEATTPTTPKGWAQWWDRELQAAETACAKWYEKGKDALKRFEDKRDGADEGAEHWNLFASGVITLRAILFGRTPQVSVSRAFPDASDDLARVAGEMLERLLNGQLAQFGDSYSPALRHALDDRLLPGLGVVWLRHETDRVTVPAKEPLIDAATGEELAPGVPEYEKKTGQRVLVEYVPWDHFLWSPCRVWEQEMRWVARKAQMGRESLVNRFGEAGRLVPLVREDKDGGDSRKPQSYSKGEVWEIWDKEHKKVFFHSRGMSEVLEEKEDYLGLEGFFPCPRPLFANPTTTALMPWPDHELARDLYAKVNRLSTRIADLEDAVKAAGVYDETAEGVGALLLNEGNKLYPVKNYPALMEKGGLAGVIQWLPIEAIIKAIAELRMERTEAIDAIYQLTGQSDIMRGQGADVERTARETGAMVKFGSVRLQALQDEFARFASDAQRLKAEIIARHFDAATILQESNAEHTFDAALRQQAVEFLKSGFAGYRVEVKPENISLQDFAEIKNERVEVVEAIGSFLTAVQPLSAAVPASMPFVLDVLRWMVSGLKGASEIEGVLDRAIEAAKKAPPQPPGSNPEAAKLQAVQMKGEFDMKKEEAKLRADIVRSQVNVQADAQREATQRQENVMEAQQKAELSVATKQNTQQKPTQGGGSRT